MNTETEEKYVSMRLAHGDIENVIRLLNRARPEDDLIVKSTLIRYCIIEYARPFKESRGVFSRKFRPLEKENVFQGGNAGHEKLMIERDQRIAHGDITALCPKLHYWREGDIFPIVQKTSQLYNDLNILIDEMLGLCDVVLRYLSNELSRLETGFREQINNNRA